MRINVMDLNTLTNGDLDFSEIEALGETRFYNVLPDDEMIEACKDAEAILINKVSLTRQVIEQLPSVKYIGLFATGYNNVNLKAASEHGIAVANVPGYSTDAVSQQVFSFILMFASSMPLYNEAVHRGEWIKSKTFSFFPYPISEIAGKKIGIVGFGNIGRKVAQIAAAFGMHVMIYTRRHVADCPYEQVDKVRLFSESDYLSLNCPLNEGTANLVNDETLALMKPTAFLINTARGGVVDSVALAEALNEGRIAGAGIDVLTVEPMPVDDPLYTAANCIITPHIGWAAIESRRRCVSMVADNLKCWMEGHPKNIVNILH